MKSFFFIFQNPNSSNKAAVEILFDGETFFQRANGGLIEISSNLLSKRNGIPYFQQGEYSFADYADGRNANMFGVIIIPEIIVQFWTWFDETFALTK